MVEYNNPNVHSVLHTLIHPVFPNILCLWFGGMTLFNRLVQSFICVDENPGIAGRLDFLHPNLLELFLGQLSERQRNQLVILEPEQDQEGYQGGDVNTYEGGEMSGDDDYPSS